MDKFTAILTILLSTGGVGGFVALLRLRVDKGGVVVDTVTKGVLVLERLNDRLEADLTQERKARREAEEARATADADANRLRRRLASCTCPAATDPPRRGD